MSKASKGIQYNSLQNVLFFNKKIAVIGYYQNFLLERYIVGYTDGNFVIMLFVSINPRKSSFVRIICCFGGNLATKNLDSDHIWILILTSTNPNEFSPDTN